VVAGDIFVMNADGSGETNLTRSPTANDYAPAWSPDGTKIAFIRGGDVYVINTDGTGLTRLTPKSADISAPADAPMFSPDGTETAFVNRRYTPGHPHEVYVYVANTDGTGLTRLTNGGIVTWVRAKNE
jgi:Tol biopolymer transport system component